jgi:hypothetical protein
MHNVLRSSYGRFVSELSDMSNVLTSASCSYIPRMTKLRPPNRYHTDPVNAFQGWCIREHGRAAPERSVIGSCEGETVISPSEQAFPT